MSRNIFRQLDNFLGRKSEEMNVRLSALTLLEA